MKRYIVLGVLALATVFTLSNPPILDSANLTSTKDTLSTSRLAVNARVDSTGTTAGSSAVKIKTSASAPANTVSTANLRAQDSVTIGTGTYTIVDIVDADEFTVTPVLASGDADDNDPVYLKMKPIHTVTFNTATAVSNGYFQILLPADTTTPNDGNPDDQGFDFGGGTVTVAATDVDDPAGGAVEYDFVTGVATAAGGTYCTAPANYHCFEVHYSGTGAVNKAITISVGSGANTPIAPATGGSHTEGTADTYTYIVKNFAATTNPSSATAIDQTSGKLALIESVRVTATVEPTINFSIAGVSTGTSTCGATPDIDTSAGVNAPLAVPFGSLASLDTFYDASHTLSVTTNAASGFVVTAIENDELSIGGSGSTTIPDTPCDSGPCTHTTSQDWATGTNNGFGYSLHDHDTDATEAFAYNESARTFSAKQFPNLGDVDVAQTIFSATTTASAQDVYVCYRISVDATQAAGDYENQVTYTATGTF